MAAFKEEEEEVEGEEEWEETCHVWLQSLTCSFFLFPVPFLAVKEEGGGDSCP